MSGLVDVLAGADVVVCCGAGGVGKTTTAAVMGLEAARRGQRAVVVTIDPARRLADALGLPGGLTSEPQPVVFDRDSDGPSSERPSSDGPSSDGPSAGVGDDGVGDDGVGGGELWAMMLDTPAMFERVVRAHATDPEQAERIVENRFFRNIAQALSGTQEYMASEALHELHTDPRFDLVIVDTPPSRNALDFLEAPGVLARFLAHPVFRLMMAPTRTGLRVVTTLTQPILRAIGRVVGSDVLADAVAFFQAFAGMEAGFRERAEAVTALLAADTTRFVLVTSPQEEAVAEATWFAEQLAVSDHAVAAVVVNRVQPDFGDPDADGPAARALAAAEAGRDDIAALWFNLVELRRIAAAQRDVVAQLAARVDDAPLVEVPLLPSDVHDQQALAHLGTHLF